MEGFLDLLIKHSSLKIICQFAKCSQVLDDKFVNAMEKQDYPMLRVFFDAMLITGGFRSINIFMVEGYQYLLTKGYDFTRNNPKPYSTEYLHLLLTTGIFNINTMHMDNKCHFIYYLMIRISPLRFCFGDPGWRTMWVSGLNERRCFDAMLYDMVDDRQYRSRYQSGFSPELTPWMNRCIANGTFVSGDIHT
jgi:hypothetical protein